MARLTLDEIKDIGTDAIRRVIGDTFTDMRVAYEIDPEEHLAYLFVIRFSTEESWRRASSLQAQLTGSLIDALYLHEDEHFPFIRIRSDGSWDFRHDAAAA